VTRLQGQQWIGGGREGAQRAGRELDVHLHPRDALPNLTGASREPACGNGSLCCSQFRARMLSLWLLILVGVTLVVVQRDWPVVRE
jgi:hypothetical protein